MSTTRTKIRVQSEDAEDGPVTSYPVDPDQVKSGDIQQFQYYVRVVRNRDGKSIDAENLHEHNDPITFNGRALVERSFSADQFHETREVSQTECIDVLLSAGQQPFTVEFKKDNGDHRKLRGTFISFDKRGRSNVIDLDKPQGDDRGGYDARWSQVDHRTLESVILRGIKYVAKMPKKKK